jgi:hypothetical protein
VLPAADAKEKADKEDRERQEKAKIDEKLAFETQRIADYTDRLSLFTIFLFGVAALQATLFTWQLLLIQSSARDTREAAEAAKLNAQSVINAERARLFIVIEDESAFSVIASIADTWDIPDSDTRKLGLPPIKYQLKNYGKTPALIHGILQGSIIESELPREREYVAMVPLPVDQVLGAGEITVSIPEPLDPVTFDQVAAIRNLSKTFWFYGSVTYEDAFRDRYTLDFVWFFNGASNGFRTFSYRETQQPSQN